MSTASWQDVAPDPRLRYRLTVEQYHNAIKSGIVEESPRFELLDGQIVHKIRNKTGKDAMTVGETHALVVIRLGRLSQRLESLGCHLRAQQPVTLPPSDEPEPDAAIVRGTPENYSSGHPGAGDVRCIIEIADASLPRDRGYKKLIYSKNGIPMYVILNLRDRSAEVFSDPLKGAGRYRTTSTLSLKDKLHLPSAHGKGLTIAVRSLLG